MSTTTVTVVFDDKVVQQALATLAGKAADMSPAMRAIARALRNITEQALRQKQASPFGPSSMGRRSTPRPLQAGQGAPARRSCKTAASSPPASPPPRMPPVPR
ncbi:MAG: phage virion morphogenesis protein [Sulfuritalea sp.]|nr:phage virion morphogenesis protein [Sulfuritalea sp.]